MPFDKGTFLLVDYTIKVKDEDRVIETTDAEIAKKANIYDENEVYEPRLVILGEGWLLKSLEDELMKMNEGEEKEIELPPEKAFGKRSPDNIKVYPARELIRRRVRPIVGTRVEIDGRIGIIRSVGSGRVVIDFNHPLAGKTLLCKIKAVKKIEDEMEKIKALIHRRAPKVDINKFDVSRENDVVVIKLPPEIRDAEGGRIFKYSLFRDITKYISGVRVVRFIEEYEVERKEEKAEEKVPKKPAKAKEEEKQEQA